MTISIVEIESNTAHLSKKKLHEVLQEQDDKILYVAYILHDKDHYTILEEKAEEETEEQTEETTEETTEEQPEAETEEKVDEETTEEPETEKEEENRSIDYSAFETRLAKLKK